MFALISVSCLISSSCPTFVQNAAAVMFFDIRLWRRELVYCASFVWIAVVTGILLPWVHTCASEASQQKACSSQRPCKQPVNWAGTMKTESSSGCTHQAFHICLLPPAICTEAVTPPLHQAYASGCFVCYSLDTISASWNLWGEGGGEVELWPVASGKRKVSRLFPLFGTQDHAQWSV